MRDDNYDVYRDKEGVRKSAWEDVLIDLAEYVGEFISQYSHVLPDYLVTRKNSSDVKYTTIKLETSRFPIDNIKRSLEDDKQEMVERGRFLGRGLLEPEDLEKFMDEMIRVISEIPLEVEKLVTIFEEDEETVLDALFDVMREKDGTAPDWDLVNEEVDNIHASFFEFMDICRILIDVIDDLEEAYRTNEKPDSPYVPDRFLMDESGERIGIKGYIDNLILI